jgi:hypothetical protein
VTNPLGSGPSPDTIQFQNLGQAGATPGDPLPPAMEDDGVTPLRPTNAYPKNDLKITDEKREEFLIWMSQKVQELIDAQQDKQTEWANSEIAYRALQRGMGFNNGAGIRDFTPLPFEGASTVTIPVIAMAVDPIHARLDTGIFKQDPVIRIKGLKKSILKYTNALEEFVDMNQKHRWQLRSVFSPGILEFCKLGTMFYRTEYENVEYDTSVYDEQFNVIKTHVVEYKGPKVFRVSIGDMLFPSNYTNLQDPPLIAERVRTTLDKLRIAQASGKLKNVEAIADFKTIDRTDLEAALEDASNHHSITYTRDDLTVYRVWCDYDILGKGTPQKLYCVYHLPSRSICSLRLNWYFNQRRPYTAIPYTTANNSIYGLGICEMVRPFQDSITQWERMASDNAYIANIRMFIVRKGSGIEEVPRLYAGRCFFVEEPKADFIPFNTGDIYPSTLSERQNLFGMVEKRTGVSDYLTGRESPIIGSRATATSTLALIQEGTKRVEQVLENIRLGIAEIVQNAFDIWTQYGVDGIEDDVFAGDQTGQLVKEFFDSQASHNTVRGALAIDLSATDAAGNRQVQQQLQLSIIQLMMGYYEKLMGAAQMALQAQAQAPQLSELILATMDAASKMFKDLLQKYDIRNPDDYLPDIRQYITGQPVGMPSAPVAGQGPSAGLGGQPGGPPVSPRIPTGPQPATPALPGSAGALDNGGGSPILAALTGAGQGAQVPV